DRECAAEDRHRVTGLRQKRDPLFWCDDKSSRNERTDQEQLHDCPKILERAAEAQVPQMEKRHGPDDCEGEQNGRTKTKNAIEILAKCHGGERNGRSETDCCGNESCHEPERRVINLREKMVFAT